MRVLLTVVDAARGRNSYDLLVARMPHRIRSNPALPVFHRVVASLVVGLVLRSVRRTRVISSTISSGWKRWIPPRRCTWRPRPCEI